MTDSIRTGLFPGLSYADASAALDFLPRAFGFVVATSYRDPDDESVVRHAQLDWPQGGSIMLGSSRNLRDPDDPGDPDDSGGWVDSTGRGQCYCLVESDADVDVLFARAVAAGARTVRGPGDQSYGGRGCTVRDPEGNQWSFGSYRGE